MLNSLLVFDISDDSSVEEKRDALTKYHLEITNGQNSFLCQPFHQILVISFLLCNINHQSGYEVFTLQEIRSGGTLNSSEKEVVKGFFNYISEKKPRLVLFNGRTFDIPVLKYRAIVYWYIAFKQNIFIKLAISGIAIIKDIVVIGIVTYLKPSLILEPLQE